MRWRGAVVSEKLKNVVQDLRSSVSQGESLSNAMANNSEVFDNFYVNMVRAGEASGQLPNIFNQIQDFVNRNMETQKNKKSIKVSYFCNCSPVYRRIRPDYSSHA